MNFTDEEGKPWRDASITSTKTDSNYLVIRPIVDKPKWEITEQASVFTLKPPKYLTADQAQLIKDCIEEMMEYLFGDSNFRPSVLETTRKAIQKGAEK